MEYFFIQPDPGAPGKAGWLRHTPGESPAQPRHGSMDEALAQAKGKPVVLILPGEDVLLTHVSLPIRQTARLRKAIPYALEEDLAADVEELHFALGQRNHDASDVVIIARQRLDHWLEPFKKQQMMPRAVVPDILTLPWQAGEWTLLQDENRALVRTDNCAGFSCDADSLGALLSARLDGDNQPDVIQRYPCGAVRPLQLPADTPAVKTQACDGSSLRIFAQGWHPRHSLNLLQAGYNAQTDVAKILKPWRWAAILFGLWLAAGLTQKFIERQQLQNQLAGLQTRAEQIFRQTFPDVKRIVNPRVQLEQRLKALKGGGKDSAGDFLAMLTSSGKVIGGQAELTLDNITYRNGQLNFKVGAKSLSQLDNLKQKLEKETGLMTELRFADSGKDRATGQIRLKIKQ